MSNLLSKTFYHNKKFGWSQPKINVWGNPPPMLFCQSFLGQESPAHSHTSQACIDHTCIDHRTTHRNRELQVEETICDHLISCHLSGQIPLLRAVCHNRWSLPSARWHCSCIHTNCRGLRDKFTESRRQVFRDEGYENVWVEQVWNKSYLRCQLAMVMTNMNYLKSRISLGPSF